MTFVRSHEVTVQRSSRLVLACLSDLMVSQGEKECGWLHPISWGGGKLQENSESPESNVKFAPSQLSALGFQNLVREYGGSLGLSAEAACGTLLISAAACGVFLLFFSTSPWIQVLQLANSPLLAYQPVTLVCCLAFDSQTNFMHFRQQTWFKWCASSIIFLVLPSRSPEVCYVQLLLL